LSSATSGATPPAARISSYVRRRDNAGAELALDRVSGLIVDREIVGVLLATARRRDLAPVLLRS
jgi:hypothetical protein